MVGDEVAMSSVIFHPSKIKRASRGMSARPWKEPAVSPFMATDEIRWTFLLQQLQSIFWQLICLGQQCAPGICKKTLAHSLDHCLRRLCVLNGRDRRCDVLCG
jgi:hypothetical protein